MQLVLNFKNVVVGTALITAGYCAYRSFGADLQTNDVRVLIRRHREAPPGRQLILKRRILALYQGSRHRSIVLDALDSPSPVSQALAVEVLAARHERDTLPRLLEMLCEPDRPDLTKEALARAMADFEARRGIPRLIELTDTREAIPVRTAAHESLRSLTGAGAAIKFGDATRQHWTLWWRDHGGR
ncbi:MAG: HEAT repeat domain-containing protein [bacterium]